jgi:putative transposase
MAHFSEATVYRILKEAGLIKPPATKGLPAGKEYQVKTQKPNELWHSDASYCFVVGWGYYYLISVLDDYSRMILSWKVQPRMSSPDIIEVVQEAIEFTGQPVVPVEPGPALLTDHGPGFLSRVQEEFLRLRAMQHIVAASLHPQTNGKGRRWPASALPGGSGQCDPGRCVLWPAGGDLGPERGGEAADFAARRAANLSTA